ncbi:MAG TPA: cytochrome b/b6 domain-containing protein [Anaerolineales bacterium]|nr:cytochrome b/b6 domain-containing protein [Anaerolineales bacterium]
MSNTPATTVRTYERFPLARRIEHWVMMLSFTTLAITGLPQRFSSSPISIAFVGMLGGIEVLRTIHHIAAVVMMLGTAWHLLVFGYLSYVRRTRFTMLPTLQDMKDGWQALMYNIGRAKTPPQMGRYTFEEKMEYWAFVWGAIIMGATGFLMWNPITTTRFLPGEVIPAAKAAHGGEALLAVLAIIVWHMYGVHIKRFNRSMFTGKMTEEEMLHEHPLELADIKAGMAERPLDAVALRKRQRVYLPIAGVLALFMLLGVYGFVNAEQTAITTVPRQEPTVVVFVPWTPTPAPTQTPTVPATETPLPTASSTTGPEGTPDSTPSTPAVASDLTWDNSIGELVQTKCSTCHGASALGGLNLSTYADAMAGGASGPVIIPGDSANSLIVTVQQEGNHPGQLTPEELAQLIEWIDAGALER